MILSEEVLPWLQDTCGAVDRAAAAIPRPPSGIYGRGT